MRAPVAAALALLLAGPVLAEGPGWFELEIAPTRIDAVPGEDSARAAVTATHSCPVSGTIDFEASGPDVLQVQTFDVAWKPCGRAGAVVTYSAVVVTVPEGTPAGVYRYTLRATWTNETAEAPFEVALPYDAQVAFVGSRVTQGAPGVASRETFNVSVTANAATRVALAVEAPEGWQVDAPATLDFPASPRAVRKPWTVSVLPPAGAIGDHKIALTASPAAASGGDVTDEPAAWEWYVRLPRPEPASTVDANAGEADGPTPAWLVGAGLVVGSLAALWWSRR